MSKTVHYIWRGNNNRHHHLLAFLYFLRLIQYRIVYCSDAHTCATCDKYILPLKSS